MIIRELRQSDVVNLNGITPESWNSPVEKVIERYFNASFFHPVVAEESGTIAGIGHLIMNGDTGWLGNIIVRQEFRKKGVGSRITKKLIDHCKNFKSILLIATDDGFPVYAGLGFKRSLSYLFLRGGEVSSPVSGNIRPSREEDHPLISSLDEQVTGEVRGSLLRYHMSTAIVHISSDNQEIRGFYMPDFGAGYIIAKDEEAGLNLLKYKLYHHKDKPICIPESNKPALSYLEQHAYKEYLRVPRMFLGSEANWRPELIFSRATGYTG